MSGPTVLSIGTTHPWNIAGVGLDLQIARSFDVRNLTVLAAVSAQDAGGLHALYPVDIATLRAQLNTISDLPFAAICIGALPGVALVSCVREFVQQYGRVPAVVDPVFAATLGGVFADDATIDAYEGLAYEPMVILTPNLPEAARLLGRGAIGEHDMEDAARELQQRGAHAVLLKGGHASGEPIDVLASPSGIRQMRGGRIDRDMRGTGGVLAMALACALARGAELDEAVDRARAFVRERIAAGVVFGGVNVPF